VAPDDRAVAICRNELGFGRLTVVDLDRGVSTDVGRGTHGHVGWAGESIVALRSGARTPTQIVRYDARTFDRTVLAVGPAAGWDELALPEPRVGVHEALEQPFADEAGAARDEETRSAKPFPQGLVAIDERLEVVPDELVAAGRREPSQTSARGTSRSSPRRRKACSP